jgi:hypothetical protein
MLSRKSEYGSRFVAPYSVRFGTNQSAGEAILESSSAASLCRESNDGDASTLLVSTSQNGQASYLSQQAFYGHLTIRILLA